MEVAVAQFIAARPWRGMVVLVSDMLDAGRFDRAIDALRLGGFEPFLIHVVGRQDAEPDVSGPVVLQDVESQATTRQFVDQQDAANYRAVFAESVRLVRGYFHRYGLGVAPVSTDEDVIRCVERIVLGSVHRRHTRAGVRA